MYDCPAEGCDATGYESIGSLRGHVNGTPDDEHDWSELKDQVEGGDDQQTDQQESLDGDGSDDQPEGGAHERDDHPPEGDNEMPIDENDQRQWGTDQGESRDEREPDERDDHPPEGGGERDQEGGEGASSETSGGIPLPVDKTTLFLLVGVLVAGVLLYLFLNSQNDEESTEIADESNGADGQTSAAEGGLL